MSNGVLTQEEIRSNSSMIVKVIHRPTEDSDTMIRLGNAGEELSFPI